MTTPHNTIPAWKSFGITQNPQDIVSAPEVAQAIGLKVDATNGQASGLEMDDQSTWNGKTIYELLPGETPTALNTLDGQTATLTGALASISVLESPLPATSATGTGIARVDTYESGASTYNRACQMIRLSALSQTFRNWAAQRQRSARIAAGATA